MTGAELQRIKDRISKTICETWRGDHDGCGNMISVIEGRISADDFMALFAEIDRLTITRTDWGTVNPFTTPLDDPRMQKMVDEAASVLERPSKT